MYANSVTHSFTTGAAVEKGQIVKLSSGAVVPSAAISDAAIGVAAYSAASGQLVAVIVSGPADVLVSGVVTLGGTLESDANGRAQNATTGVVIGQALEVGAAASGTDFALAKVNLFPSKVA